MNSTIERILRDIENYLRRAEKYRVKSPEDLVANEERSDALSMVLFSLLTRALDLGEEVIRDRNMGYPSTYREVIQILGHRKLLDRSLARDMNELIKFRNKFAHEYSIIRPEDIFVLQEKIQTVRRYVRALKRFLT